MDGLILAYFRARLDQIAHASSPHLARWTRTDRLMLGWALRATESPQEPLPDVGQYCALREAVWQHLRAFLLDYAEYSSAKTFADRFTSGEEMDARWHDLLLVADTLLDWERDILEGEGGE
jgi:hypothetical protein